MGRHYSKLCNVILASLLFGFAITDVSFAKETPKEETFQLKAFRAEEVEECEVTINVNLLCGIPSEDKLYISGNTPEMGSWAPDKIEVPFDAKGRGIFKINAIKGRILQFKITRGSWNNQAIYSEDNPQPNNIIVNVDKTKTVAVNVVGWMDRRSAEDDPILGQIRFLDLFECKNMIYKRGIFVWLPEGYSQRNGPYSVLYFHDGQNLFLPSKSYSGKDWKVDEVASKLMKERKMKHCIVVAIPNSPARDSELNLETKDGKAYAEFVVNEVVPFMKEKFPVSNKREDHIIAGSSMGGLMSFQMAYKYTDVFGGALCMSSAFQRSLSNVLDKVKCDSNVPLKTKFYLDTGELEVEKDSKEDICSVFNEMSQILQDKGFVIGQNLLIYCAPKAEHNEAAWAQRLHIPLEFLLKR